MTPLPNTSRRTVLRVLAGAPLIPVVGFATSALLRRQSRPEAANAPTSADFTGMGAPDTAAAQATTSVGSSLEVTYADGTKQSFKLGYQPLFLTGDQVPDGKGGTVLAGGYYDVSGKPILDTSATPPDADLLRLPGRLQPALAPRRQRPGRDRQHRLRRGAVRIHHPRRQGREPLRPAPRADRRAHLGPGQADRRAQAGEV